MCYDIKMVLIDSHGYSTKAGTHATSLTVVIYALLLGDLHWKMTAAQYHVESIPLLFWHYNLMLHF